MDLKNRLIKRNFEKTSCHPRAGLIGIFLHWNFCASQPPSGGFFYARMPAAGLAYSRKQHATDS
jgi:hypothetical protein